MLILEKIIHSENDTCTEDDNYSNLSRIIRKAQKMKKEKKKLNEVDWIKVRQLNQVIRRRLEHAKYDVELQRKMMNDSAETGTSNILDAIRDELTTDNDQGRSVCMNLGGVQLSGIAQLAADDLTVDE